MKAKDFDKKFDKGGDITAYLDVTKSRRPEQELKRNNDAQISPTDRFLPSGQG